MSLFGGGGLFGGSGGGLFGGSGGGLFGGSGGGSFSPIVREDPIGYTPLPESIKEKMRDSDSVILQTVAAVDDAGEELHEVLSDGKEEFREIMTDGVVEMVIKGNKNYKTSFEIKEEAQKRKAEANARYNNKLDSTNNKINLLNQHISDNLAKKEKLLSDIESHISDDKKVHKVGNHILSSPSYEKPQIDWFSVALGGPSVSKRARKEAAEDYLEDVKDFEVEVSGKIAELDRICAKIDAIEGLLIEEDKLLEALKNSISLSRPDNCKELADVLNGLVKEYIIDQSGNPNSTYQKMLKNLDKICSSM